MDKSRVDPKIREAAEGMEAMFLDYMMKVMRDTVPKNEMDSNSPAVAIYQGMRDTEFAHTAAKSGGIGLADQLIAYLDSQSYTLPREQGVPAPVKSAGDQQGGSHAGQLVNK